MTANDATLSGPPAAAGGQGAARQAGARLRRLAAVLAVLTCGLLACAAAVPAAFAAMLPDKGPPAVGVPATATAQQPDKPGSPARASPCSEAGLLHICSGGGYATGTSTTRPPAYSLPMILLGAGDPGPCSEVCSGGGYGSVGPPSRTPGDSSAHDTARIPPAGGRVTASAGFHWGDAGIGAGAMLALIVLGLGGTLTLTRRPNHRTHDKCSPRLGRLWAAQSASAQGTAGRSRRSPDEAGRAPDADVPPGADLITW